MYFASDVGLTFEGEMVMVVLLDVPESLCSRTKSGNIRKDNITSVT